MLRRSGTRRSWCSGCARGSAGNERVRGPEKQPDLEVVDVDAAHLDERLGLFVIIVLGEAVSQLVVPAATTEWTPAFVQAGGARLRDPGRAVVADVQLRLHRCAAHPAGRAARRGSRCRSTCVTRSASCAWPPGWARWPPTRERDPARLLRWVMCAGLALHFLVTGIGGMASGAPRRWLLGWALPCTVVPLLLAAVGARSPTRLTRGAAACVGWMVGYGRLSRRRAASTEVDNRPGVNIG